MLCAAGAIAVRPVAPAAVTYLVGSVAALAAAYGLDVSQEMVGAINGLVVSGLMFLTRGQVTPAADPRVINGTVIR